MEVAVIGAGVVGVTTALALKKRGHKVHLLERNAKAGMETSYANAGQRSYGVVYPWASLSMLKRVLPKILQADAPLKIHLPPSFKAAQFMLATLRYAVSPTAFRENKLALLALGEFSRQCFLKLEEAHQLNFSGQHQGLLQLASDTKAMLDYQKTGEMLQQTTIPFELLSAEEVRRIEPNMNPKGPLVGALYYPNDGTGDCHQFTQQIAQLCDDLGVDVQYNQRVSGFNITRDKIDSVIIMDQTTSEHRTLEVDAYVVCGGCWSPAILANTGLVAPIYPVKGYSITAPLMDIDSAPASTVHDDYYKVVTTRLGERLRATGFVELNDFNRQIPQNRLATIFKSVDLRFPNCARLDEAEPWTGFRPMTPDGPAMIGKGPQHNLYINTGHGTFGWTFSAGSAELIAQIICGEPLEIDIEPFRPDRF